MLCECVICVCECANVRACVRVAKDVGPAHKMKLNLCTVTKLRRCICSAAAAAGVAGYGLQAAGVCCIKLSKAARMRLNTRTGIDSGRQVGQDGAKAVIQNSSGSGWRQRNQRQDALCGNKRDFRVAASWQRAAEMQPCGRVLRNLFTPVLTLLFCQLQFDLSHQTPPDHLANTLPKCGKCPPSLVPGQQPRVFLVPSLQS